MIEDIYKKMMTTTEKIKIFESQMDFLFSEKLREYNKKKTKICF